jgi:hypothetical protein
VHDTRRSSDVDEIWSNIAQHLNLLLGLAVQQVIARARLAQLVLALEHDVHEDGAAEQEEEHVREHDSVAGLVSRGLLAGEVDVGGYHAVHVAPSDDDADHDTALERALDVVGRPCQRIGDGRVDAHGAEEGAGVLDVHVLAGEQHGKANASDEGDDHVAVAAPLGAVGHPAGDDGHGGGDGVWGNGQELSLGTLVSHAEQDGGQKQREAVQRAQAAHVDDGVSPRLPVHERRVDVSAVNLANGGAGLAIRAETTHGAQLLVGREETCGVGEVKHHPPAEDTDDDGHEPFDYEDPTPSFIARDAVHLGNGGGEESSKRASKCSGGEEESSTETKFLALVPATIITSALGRRRKNRGLTRGSSSHRGTDRPRQYQGRNGMRRDRLCS